MFCLQTAYRSHAESVPGREGLSDMCANGFHLEKFTERLFLTARGQFVPSHPPVSRHAVAEQTTVSSELRSNWVVVTDGSSAHTEDTEECLDNHKLIVWITDQSRLCD